MVDMEISNMEVVANPQLKEKDAETSDIVNMLKEKLKDIERGVNKKEPKFIQKIMSKVFSIRKLLNEEILAELIADSCHSYHDFERWIKLRHKLIDRGQLGKKCKIGEVPEVSAFLHLLVALYLVDSGELQLALECSENLMQKLCQNNQHTMDSIAARAYFYHSRVYEQNGKLGNIRSFLLSRLRTCSLKNDTYGQAVLINCIIRNYLTYYLYESADKFVSKIKFPEHADNNEWARYLYYLARIKATRLEYSEARRNVILALRKAPESSALGFRQAANKLAISIELLLGDIPDKRIFQSCKMKNSLEPYFKVTQAVRDGNLLNFSYVLEKYSKRFRNDHTYNLILRLRRNVIKTAIRAIGLSYARISPIQVAKKLGLDSAEEALYILTKAIRDGVIEASLIDEFLVSREEGNLYKSLVPTESYKERIAACLQLHNYSVKSMRYPMKKYESKLDSSGDQDDECSRPKQVLNGKSLYENKRTFYSLMTIATCLRLFCKLHT